MESLLDISQQLIAISSTADNKPALHKVLDIITTQISANQSLIVERFESGGEPSLLAYKGKKRPSTFRVLLNGHVDVVPGKKEQFTPIIKDGRLYGRGASDMKVAAVALTQVFCDMVEKVPYPLGLQIVTDEEVGGENGTAYQLAQGVTTQLAIAGEFTPLGTICNESRGFCWAEIEFTGASAHSAYPWNGTNAILLAQEFTEKLLAAIPTPASDEWCTTANIATISTPNTTFNKVPGRATLGVDIRFTANDTRFASHQTATEFLQNLAPKDTAVHLKKLEPSHYANPESTDLQVLAKVVTAISGQPAAFIHKHGAADIRFFSQKGIPAVTLGVQGQGIHSDNEYVEIDSIERYVATLTTFLQDITP